MEMESIVKSFLGKVNEVVGYRELLRKRWKKSTSDGHLLSE